MRGSVVEFTKDFDTLVISGKVNVTIDAQGRVTSNDPKNFIAMKQTENVLRIMSDPTGGGICFRGENVIIQGMQVDDTSSCTIRVKSIKSTGVISVFGGGVYVNNQKIPDTAPERRPIQQTFVIRGPRIIRKIYVEGESKTFFDPKNDLVTNFLDIVQSSDARFYVINNQMFNTRLVVHVTGNGKIVTKKNGTWIVRRLQVSSSGAGTLKGITAYDSADIGVSGVGLVEVTTQKDTPVTEQTSGLGEIVLNRLPY
jgi:hypothetical protein